MSEAATGSAEEIEQFRQRQISRMVILGATAENKPLLEESYLRMLAAFEPHVGMTSYLFGSRPSLADFAWFGQLSEMATDPTPMRIMREKAPFTDHWVRRLDDASGVEGEWYPREQALGGMAEALLRIAGELYLPFLVANAEAFAKGLDRLEINVWGLPYALAPFKYQVKCLQQLRDKFAALDAEDRAALRPVLERTGCWPHLNGRAGEFASVILRHARGASLCGALAPLGEPRQDEFGHSRAVAVEARNSAHLPDDALRAQSLGKSLRIAISAASPGDSTLPSNAGWRSVTMS